MSTGASIGTDSPARPGSPAGWFGTLLFWGALAAMTTLSVYGYLAEDLDPWHMWTATGLARFPKFTMAYGVPAMLLAWFAPGYLLRFLVAGSTLVAMWLAGPGSVLSAGYLVGAFFLTGRWILRQMPGRETPLPGAIPVLLGAALWMQLVWLAIHFPINTPAVYWVALMIPYLAERHFLTARIRDWPTLLQPASRPRSQAFALTLLFWILAAHLLIAMGPEISSDGLSMHLVVPTRVASDGLWPFDYARVGFSMMPLGADSLYTAAYLLGDGASWLGRSFAGEAAARLLNFAILLLTLGLIAKLARRWVSPVMSVLIAALFATTPLVQLVTGSLMVENTWTAFLVAAGACLLLYLDSPPEAGTGHELLLTAIFLGSAGSVKLIAAAYILPLAGFALIAAIVRARARHDWKPLVLAAALALVLAAPPYVYALAKTGNPIFPFKNTLFQSPYYDTTTDFDDPRFTEVDRGWYTPYELFFKSGKFMEGEPGAGGFQYFLLLLPAALLIRSRQQAAIMTAVLVGPVIIMLSVANLRYMYPSMALGSIAIAWALAAFPGKLRGAVTVALILLNLAFFNAASWYNRDFALFRPSEYEPDLERMAPVRVLIERLNEIAPGEPVAIYETDTTAGLLGHAYVQGWHSERYWSEVSAAADDSEVARIWKDRGIHYVIAPATKVTTYETSRRALELWTDPMNITYGFPSNPFSLFRVRDMPLPRDQRPYLPGTYDDHDVRLDYSGHWTHDTQWPESGNRSITYSDQAGDRVLLDFEGSGIAYSYTAALNRGIAEVWIDGELVDRRDLYSPETLWQQRTVYDGLGEGHHSFDLRVSGDRNPASEGAYVDIDGFEISGF